MKLRFYLFLAAITALWIVIGWFAAQGIPSQNQVNAEAARKVIPVRHSEPADSRSLKTPPSLPGRGFPIERKDSGDLAERALANGQLLEERVYPGSSPDRWRRERLVRSTVQERLLHVKEEWEHDAAAGRWLNLGRDIYLADQLIIKVRPKVSTEHLSTKLAEKGMVIVHAISENLFTLRLPTSDLDALQKGINTLAGLLALVESAEPDGVGFGSGIPNDTSFSTQWGNHNTGQSGGTVNADVDAPEFWDILAGTPGLVIAVLDTGLNMTHPDLHNLAWTNPNEIAGDGIDNDFSGRIDDVTGWDFVNNDNNPTDDNGHGSNVSGIIAASRNNSTGIAGMIGGVKIIVCKILNSSSSGLTSDLIAATTYARLRNVPVMNLSLQSYPFSTALYTEFMVCEAEGILLSICAGNQGVNNDFTPNYPSSYTHTNIIAVGNHDRTDVRWSGSFNPSNYGGVSVDLFAPGREINGPILGTSYSLYTGTSQATPYVTAVAAAIKYLNPSWHAAEIKNSILSTVITRPAYSGICTTGGRLNALTSVSYAVRQMPLADTDADGFSNLFEYAAGTRMDSSVARPLISVTTNGGFFKTGITYALRPDASFEIQRSTDLSSWLTSGISNFNATNITAAGIPMDGSLGRFLRVRLVTPP